MAADRAKTYNSHGHKGAVIVPGATDLDPLPKSIVCMAAGNVTVVPVGNIDADTITFTACPVGFIPPFYVRRVTAATGSWATVLD